MYKSLLHLLMANKITNQTQTDWHMISHKCCAKIDLFSYTGIKHLKTKQTKLHKRKSEMFCLLFLSIIFAYQAAWSPFVLFYGRFTALQRWYHQLRKWTWNKGKSLTLSDQCFLTSCSFKLLFYGCFYAACDRESVYWRVHRITSVSVRYELASIVSAGGAWQKRLYQTRIFKVCDNQVLHAVL